jgi:hypothetical protein
MISRSIKQYLQFGLLMGYVGFVCASDKVLSEYKKRVMPIKEDILQKMRESKEIINRANEIDAQRIRFLDNKIKAELGSESAESFFNRVNKYSYGDYIDFRKQQERYYDKKRAELLNDKKKGDRLTKLYNIKGILETIDKKERDLQLKRLDRRIENPELYFNRIQYEIFEEKKYTPDFSNPSRRFAEHADSLKRRFERIMSSISDQDTDWEEWGDDKRFSAQGRLIEELDAVVLQQLEKVDKELEQKYSIPAYDLSKKLGLEAIQKPGGTMSLYSPLEPAISQRVAAYFAPRMQQVGSWWNRFTQFTSNWFAATPNRFAVMKSVRMPKLQQPRIVGPEIKDIPDYELWKPSEVLSPYGK